MTTRAAPIALYCDLIAKAAIDGISRAQGELGVDVGAPEKPVVERGADAPADAISASSRCPVRAASPTISRSCPACRRRSRRSSTISASSTTGRSPSFSRKAAHNVGEEVGLPGRVDELGRQGQGTDGRSE